MEKQVTTDEALLVAALAFTGRILKGSSWFPSAFIPHTLLAVGSAAGYALLGQDPRAALHGAVCASVAVFGHQLVKQSLTHDATH
jgi:hypothetical protein